jgi:S1-C subfamily serine protease
VLRVFTVFLLVASMSWSESRTWTDATGKFKVEATLLRIEGENAILKKTDGKDLPVPIQKLSEADQRFIRESQAEPKAGPPDAVVSSIEKQALSLRTAEDAVLFYTKVLVDPGMQDLRPQLEARRGQWETLAKANSLRMGDKWLSLADAKKLEESEKLLLEEASRMIDVHNLQLAGEKLRKASQANPQSIQADFLIGLVLSLALKQPEEAQKYFSTCIQRRQKYSAASSNAERANLVASLNNFAIVKVKQGEFRPALAAWRQAIELGLPSKELIQNLGKMSALPQTHPHLKIPSAIGRESSELYSKVSVATSAPKYKPETGWLFMPLVDEPTAQQVVKAESSKEIIVKMANASSSSANKDVVLLGGGSGFVVAPNYVITNHHVIENADAIKIVTTAASGTLIDASVVTMSSDPDLALLTCANLNAQPLAIRKDPIKLGAEIAIVGFPEFIVLGTDLKATRGVVSGLPNPVTGEVLIYDAVSNQGNSGGPVCDRFGNIVAVHRLGFNVQGKFAAGVPAIQVQEFLDTKPDVKYLAGTASKEMSWEDVIESVGKSTVQVLVYQKASNLKLAKRESLTGAAANWEAFEDNWCMTCNGTSLIECPGTGCTNGKIRTAGVEVIGNTANDTKITKRVTKSKDCSICDGRGRVRCPFCSNGVEYKFRR